jgi:hypothetical protein
MQSRHVRESAARVKNQDEQHTHVVPVYSYKPPYPILQRAHLKEVRKLSAIQKTTLS